MVGGGVGEIPPTWNSDTTGDSERGENKQSRGEQPALRFSPASRVPSADVSLPGRAARGQAAAASTDVHLSAFRQVEGNDLGASEKQGGGDDDSLVLGAGRRGLPEDRRVIFYK